MPGGKIPRLTIKPNSCASIAFEKCSSKSCTINHGKLRNYQLTLTCFNRRYPVQAMTLVEKVAHGFCFDNASQCIGKTPFYKEGVTRGTCVV